MVTLGDLIKQDKIEIEGNDKDILCLKITASWEDIIKQGEGK